MGWKAAEAKKGIKVVLCRCFADFAQGKRVQPMVMIPSLEGVSSPAVIIQPGRSGDQKRNSRFTLVIETLDYIPPFLLLMDLVENVQFSVQPYYPFTAPADRPRIIHF